MHGACRALGAPNGALCALFDDAHGLPPLGARSTALALLRAADECVEHARASAAEL